MCKSAVESVLQVTGGHLQTTPRDNRGVLAFKGIPYAAPPVGPLRWRPPQPVIPWHGLRSAERFGPRCPNASMPGTRDGAKGESEDCLTLNVWTAAHHSAEKRPVMVWLHGGGFQFGSSAVAGTDGAAFAAAGIVLVTINYRLGIFGFLAHPALDAEGAASGNYGLRDQIAALQWVAANIAQFGGDPDRVTLFGESAGAHAVGLLMTSRAARGLFHRAIAQSGAWWDSEHGSLPTAAAARQRGAAWMHQHAAGSLAAARAMPAETLRAKANWNFLLDPATSAFAPSIDGDILTGTPARIFQQGLQADVPLMAGRNTDEGSLFRSRGPSTSPGGLQRAATLLFGREAVRQHAAEFPKDRRAAHKAADKLTGDLVIGEQVHAMLGTHAQTSSQGAWGYQFGHTSAFLPRAVHTGDVPFVFGNLVDTGYGVKPPATAPDDERSRDMLIRWVAFASHGIPNAKGLSAWPPYHPANPVVMHFGPGPTAPGPEDATQYFGLINAQRNNGRLPGRWSRTRGRLPLWAAALLRRLLLTALRIKSYTARQSPSPAASHETSLGKEARNTTS